MVTKAGISSKVTELGSEDIRGKRITLQDRSKNVDIAYADLHIFTAVSDGTFRLRVEDVWIDERYNEAVCAKEIMDLVLHEFRAGNYFCLHFVPSIAKKRFCYKFARRGFVHSGSEWRLDQDMDVRERTEQ